MIIKAMVPQLWDVSRSGPLVERGVMITRIQRPQAAWVYRGEWTNDMVANIPAEIMAIAEQEWFSPWR